MPTAVRLPRLLGSDFGEARRVHPTSLSLELQRRSCSTAQLVLPEEEARLPFLSFLELFTAKGSAGLFRVVSPSEPVAGTRTYSLRHAIDTLRDSRWKAQDYDFSGTMAAFLSALLAQQAAVRWQLGTCADTGTWTRNGINYDSLDELLDEVRQDRNDYIFTYDFSTTPWTLNFVHASGDTVDCELRQTRNLSDGQLRRTRDGMCNILYLSVSTTTDHETAVTYQTYQDAASIAQFGPIEGTAGIDTADVADPAAWAARFLQDHAWPIAQASADGFELVKATGEAWDELDIGKTARLSVTRDGFPAAFPIETLRYDQLFGETPEKVRAELNRPLPRFSEALAKARETAQRAYGAGRSNQKALKENEHFQHMSKETKEGMEDCFGVIGVKLDPVTHEPLRDAQGNYIWAGPNDAAAEIWGHLHRNAWETQILNHIKDANGNVISLAEVYTDAYGQAIINAINDQQTGTAQIRADRIKIDSTSGSSFSIENDGTMTFNAENAIAAINAATAEINAGKIALNSAGTITLAAKLGINANGLLRVDGGEEISGALFADSDVYVGNDLYIESGHTIQFNDGNDYVDYYPRDLRFGWGSNGFVKSVLSSSATEIAVGMEAAFDSNSVYTLSFKENTNHNYNTANLTHYHDITATEGTGQNAGKILFTLGAPRSTEGTTNFNIAATQFYVDGVAAAEAAGIASVTLSQDLPSNGTVRVLASNGEEEFVDWRTVNQVSSITLGSSDTGSSVSKTINVQYDNGDNTSNIPITIDASAVYAAGQNSVSALIVDGNNTPYSGPHTMAGGTTLTLYPAKYVGGSTEKNTGAALVITAESGADSVVLDTGFDIYASTQDASTSQIVFLDTNRHGVYIDVQVGVRLSNGKQYKRWITDINTGFTFFGDMTLFSYDSTDEDYNSEGRRNWYYK